MFSPSPSLVFPTPPSDPRFHVRFTSSLAEEIAALLGDGSGLRHIRSQVERIGPHFRLALITGETGSGKEQVARCLHLASSGADGPFLVTDPARLESVLLSSQRGLTVSLSTPSELGNLLESSRGGTLFLDEVASLSLAGQAALLNVLDLQARSRGHRDARIIASTSRSLRALAASGAFRQDLLYRISAVEIAVPSLRERKGDIPGLANRFLQASNQLHGKSFHGITRETLDRLCRYEWPGNVRELESVIRTAVIHCEGASLDLRHLPSLEKSAPTGSDPCPPQRSVCLQDVVEEHVLDILRRCDGNKLRAAELLGISRSTLYRMLDSVAAAREA